MHRKFPRCYLNTKCSREILAEMGKSFADCELDKQGVGGCDDMLAKRKVEPAAHWDLLVKGAAVDVLGAAGSAISPTPSPEANTELPDWRRDVFRTQTNRDCTLSSFRCPAGRRGPRWVSGLHR